LLVVRAVVLGVIMVLVAVVVLVAC